jgi:hypothetical protein
VNRRLGRLTVGLLLLGLACDEKPAPPPRASATASAPAAPTPSQRPQPARAPRKPPTCRALAVTGKVLAGDQPVAVGTAVDGKTWLLLEKGASVSFRHSVSAREVTLVGPAQALPCFEGEEDFLLGSGQLRSSAGPGARPGAQVTVYTPFGTFSYGDARIDVQTSKSQAELAVTQGEAWATPIAGATRTGPDVVRAPKGKATLRGAPKPAALVADCEKQAGVAEGLASQVLHPTPGPDAGTLGERAAAHMGARRAARGACWCARAAVALAPDASRRDLAKRLDRAEQQWRAIGDTRKPPSD